MAKSRVLQILEYDETQRQNLIKNLKLKNINSTQGESLGSLVEKVNTINIDKVDTDYERDPNFPNIDELFDNDPLRMANGGQYKCCSYGIHRLTETNQIKIYEVYNASYGARKVVISDGKEYNDITSTINTTYTVQENGIYVGEDGFKYCMVIVYADDLETNTGTFYVSSGIYEYINDRTLLARALTQQATTPDTRPSNMRYYRFVGSNITKELLQEKATATTYSATIDVEHLVLEGLVALSTLLTGSNNAVKKMVLNCEIYIPNNTSTTQGLTVGNAASGYAVYATSLLPFFKTPYCEKDLSMSMAYSAKNVYISDNVTTFEMWNSSGGESHITDLHIGNRLTATIKTRTASNSTPTSKFYNLRNLTVSEGAYGLNTTALTLDFSYSSKMSRQSVLNLFNNLADRTGMTANVLKLHAFTKTLVTDEEKAILTAKNWTLS